MGIYYVSGIPYSSDYLMHYGILGQKWGIRRFQNPDGTLNAAGRERYKKQEFNKAKSVIEGKRLLEKNQTVSKVITKASVNQAILAGAIALNAFSMTNLMAQTAIASLMTINPVVGSIGLVGMLGSGVAGIMATPINLINSAKKVSRIRSAEKAGYTTKDRREAMEELERDKKEHRI